ncbi:MAG: hypothetical protein P0Y53_11560 [Candidatus Pseudobacter hemicellulosilyticus]|uniref:Outer membrane protein beta-barrel domain-containing protein n=1 Tax=Candidatus Pseudobacter hemicellulosilyticus TaxID=3121375 RepID=A0AAJ6BJQ4_9BACT|nr:MAG: hypothetical protein P0Y53_11560 [Pseudobacter sp.]
MNRICIWLIIACCHWQAVRAQAADTAASSSGTTAAWRFQSINSVGLAVNSNSSGWLLQSVNGIRKQSWFAGIGVGIDQVRFRGIPVFVDLRKYLFSNPRSKYNPFVYADAGVHISVPSESDKNHDRRYHFNNGLYTDAGLGLNLALPRQQALALSLGYSYKSVKFTEVPYNPIAAAPTVNRDFVRYELSRISVKLGWVWGK